RLQQTGITLEQPKVTPQHLAEVLALVEQGMISLGMGRQVFEESFREGASPAALVRERGLAQVSDEGELTAAVAQALEANPAAVADYRAGKATAINFLKGQVMK